jgi:hypothetical protein
MNSSDVELTPESAALYLQYAKEKNPNFAREHPNWWLLLTMYKYNQVDEEGKVKFMKREAQDAV